VRVGAEVQSSCRKCGFGWHVVIAMSAGEIAQVECGECRARHRYRPADARKPGASRAGKLPKTKHPAKKRAAVVEADLSRPPRSFSARETYVPGDRLMHSSFGEGVVQAVMGPSKIEVLFETGVKVLVHARG